MSGFNNKKGMGMSGLSKELIKKEVQALLEFINAGGVKALKTSSAYQCIAKIHGYKDWNTLKAFLDKSEEIK